MEEAKKADAVDAGSGGLPVPDEVLLMIFSHLGQRDLLLGAGLVCTKWSNMARDGSLWEGVELDGRCVSVERAGQLITTMRRLKRVRLVGWQEPLMDTILTLVADLCPGLEMLELIFCHVGSCEGLQHVAQTCKEIKELKMIVFPTHPIPHPWDVFAQSSKLEKISLLQNSGYMDLNSLIERIWPKLRDVELYTAVKCDRKLQALCSGAAGQLRKLTIGPLDHPASCQLLNQCCKLEFLELILQFGVKLRHLQDGIRQLQNLRSLTVHKYVKATAAEIISFFSARTVVEKLKFLKLYCFRELDDHCLFVIGTNCPQLTSISLSTCSNVTKDGLASLFSACRQLKAVELDGVKYIAQR